MLLQPANNANEVPRTVVAWHRYSSFGYRFKADYTWLLGFLGNMRRASFHIPGRETTFQGRAGCVQWVALFCDREKAQGRQAICMLTEL